MWPLKKEKEKEEEEEEEKEGEVRNRMGPLSMCDDGDSRDQMMHILVSSPIMSLGLWDIKVCAAGVYLQHATV